MSPNQATNVKVYQKHGAVLYSSLHMLAQVAVIVHSSMHQIEAH